MPHVGCEESLVEATILGFNSSLCSNQLCDPKQGPDLLQSPDLFTGDMPPWACLVLAMKREQRALAPESEGESPILKARQEALWPKADSLLWMTPPASDAE